MKRRSTAEDPGRSDSDWLTWEQAAELVGCPVPTIDWYTRMGRIRHRARRGHRPTLERQSVEDFARWHRDRETRRRRKRELEATLNERRAELQARAQRLGLKRGQVPPLTLAETGWITAEDAAKILEVTPHHAVRLIRAGTLTGRRLGKRWWFEQQAVLDLAAERGQWISQIDAARLVGCSAPTIAKAAAEGRIRSRVTASRQVPALERASVTQFARRWRGAAEERRAALARPRPEKAPPDDGHVWLDTTTTALVLGVTKEWVYVLAREQKLPSIEYGGRRWFRRDHVETAAAARAARARFRAAIQAQ